MKSIKFKFGNKNYELTYTRETVFQAEDKGFSLAETENKPLQTAWGLFKFSFLAKHPDIDDKKINEIFDRLEDRQSLISYLAEIYSDTVSSLINEDNPKNAIKWEMNQ